jgi:hypothetical protein
MTIENTDQDEILELDPFYVKSNISFDGNIIHNTLPGKYVVLRQTIDDTTSTREGNLFILHESVADENIPLNNYAWEEGGRYDSQDDSVKILDLETYDRKLKGEEVEEKFADSMAEVIGNMVCFTMLQSDFGYRYNVLKKNNMVVGINVDGIGSWIDTPDVLMSRACQNGDLEKVRYYLHSPELKVNATIEKRNYECYYWACTNGHKDIITYLLTSPELKNHCRIGMRENTPFTILCNSNPEIVRELILELPMKNLEEMKVLFNGWNTVTHKEEFQRIIKIREMNDNLQNDLEIKPEGKSKMNI